MNVPKDINRDYFFENRGSVNFVKGRSQEPFQGGCRITTLPGAGWHKHEEVWKCNICGWCEHSFHSYIDGKMSWGMKDWELTINNAILHRTRNYRLLL